MRPGDVVLIELPQVGGGLPKLRPALVLAELPGPYQNILICGISTRFQDLLPDWDEVIDEADEDYPESGLHRASAVRLSYLYATEQREILGTIGRVDAKRLHRLAARLADRLVAAGRA